MATRIRGVLPLGASFLAAAVLTIAPATPAVAATPGWLDRLNSWRAATGVTALAENTTWDQGDYNHSLYMVKNDQVTHYEVSTLPYYTVDGDTAARNGNIEVNSSTSFTDEQSIDWWMAAPFHELGMMDPRLSSTGFGSYREVKSGWDAGFTLDTLRGNSFSGGAYPVYFPGNGSSVPLTSYQGGEFPDPLQACSGYAAPTGLPITIQIGGNVATSVSAHTFTGNGTPLEHCMIDSNSPSVGSNLTGRGAAILIPRQALQAGVSYVVALTVNGLPYTWSFTVNSTNSIVPGGALNGWSSVGGIATSSADASSWGSTRSDVFARGTDNGLWQRSWNGSAWGNWQDLGGVLTSDPAAVSWSSNRIDVFVRGSDNQLYHKASDGTSWSVWQALGGIMTSGAAVASWSNGRLDVFVRGTDNALWHKWWDGSTWSAWQNLGGILTSDPAAVSWGPNRVDVFVRGTDNGLWQKSWNGSAWTNWTPLGGMLTTGPGTTSCSAGHLDVFVVGSDHAIYQIGYNGAWGAWNRIGGAFVNDPGAVCPTGTASVSLYELAADASVVQSTATPS